MAVFNSRDSGVSRGARSRRDYGPDHSGRRRPALNEAMSDKPECQNFDVIIVGGGMVGASLAHALSGHGLSIAVIESYPLNTSSQPSYDDRAIALSYGTKRILDALGLWPKLASSAEAINKIHVSEQGQFGFARLDHLEEGVEEASEDGTLLLAREHLVDELGHHHPTASAEQDVDLDGPVPGPVEDDRDRPPLRHGAHRSL